MQSYTTDTWGYKILSENTMSFYHVLLPQISLQELYTALPNINYITPQNDGSIFLQLDTPSQHFTIIKSFQSFFERKSIEHLDTPRSYYKIPLNMRQSLLSWSLAFEGCLGMLLVEDTNTKHFLKGKWEYLNSRSGGLYLAPYTLLFYDEYPRIVHPITVQNYAVRKSIEQTTASLIRKIVRRVTQSQAGMEGIALLSLTEEKTNYTREQITQIINEKSQGIKAPFYSQFFQSHAL